ncbi:MAG: Cobalt-zinc-cadmium resistance protein CzcA [Fimbriimonadaceae bacterium]|nr:Cobalt-zinc-cadmium resistance protein CzcA [Fimbriimonadaceae bacterium]
MLNRVVDWSIQNRVFVVIAWLAIAIAGVLCALTLPIDAVPDISGKQVVINTAAPALGPEEIELQITQPLETTLSGIPSSTGMRSISQFGLSQITVIFDDRTDIYWARQQVTERLAEAREHLPPGSDPPALAPIATGLGEIYYVFVESDRHSLMEKRSILDWQVRPRLRTVPGIIEVNSFGGHVKQYQVLADPAKLRSHGLTLGDLRTALEKNNRNAGGAYIPKENEQQVIQGVGLVRSLDDIRGIVLASRNGAPVLVADVARVEFGHALRQGTITKDGRGEAVAAIAVMLMGENTRTATQLVKARLEEIRKEMPEGIRLDGFLDRTVLVNDTLKTAGTNLAEGGLLVILILFLFLLQFRAGLIVSSAIPLAMLFAIIGMRYFGVSANLMSLGAIDFGLIVDAAVIIVENCVRRLAIQRHEVGRELTDTERLETIRSGTVEVRQASQFGELIIIAAYLPVLSLVSVEGKMFRPMALTVIFALVGALLMSATLVPALCAYFLKVKEDRENPVVAWLQRGYLPAVRWAMRWRGPLVAGAAVFFVATALLFPRLGAEFLPKLDEGAVSINPGYLPGISVETAIERATLAERVLLEKFPNEIVSVATRIGRPDIATDPMLLSQHDIFVPLRPKSEWKVAKTKPELVEKMLAALSDVPGMKVAVTQPIEMRMAEMSEGVGVRSEVGAKVFGPEMAVLQRKAIEVADIMRETAGGEDVFVEATAGLPVLQIRIRRGDIARYGLNVSDVQDVIETAIGGAVVGEVVEGAARYDMLVRFEDSYRGSPEAIRRLPVYGAGGQRVPLFLLADVESLEGPVQISRETGQRRVVVQANVRGRDLGSFVQEAKRKVDAVVNLPPGYRIEWGGQYEHLESASARLMIVVPVTFGIIFLLLYITYRRVLDALRVFTGIPFAISGGILALYLRGMPFSISAGVGFIALSGIAVLADMVMVQTIRNNLDRGMALQQAVEHAAITRLRPVLMTALVAAIGFVPMALSTGTGAEVQKPLATVVIGGVITSTTLTLLVLPALYMLMSGWKGGNDTGHADPAESGLPKFSAASQEPELVHKLEPKEVT